MTSIATISIYEHAWRLHQQTIPVDTIAAEVGRHRATIYRWFRDIKRIGIREFVRRKRQCKHRRPRARTPEYVIQKIVDLRVETGWCGQKIQKELRQEHGIRLGLATIYRWLHARMHTAVVGVRKYHKHQAMVTASAPRQVVEHDTVDLGELYAYTALDIFTKEPSVFIGTDLEMETGARAFAHHHGYYGDTELHQSDNGSEFRTDFVAAVEDTGAKHRYSRPYKKNEQAHIENFNKALRSECLGKAYYSTSELAEVQQKVDEFIRHYIHQRWHMGLPDMITPAQFQEWYANDPERAKVALEKVYG
ncbi:hypothetical protein BRC19_02265 [Candidatus Saccharibacteria bacterium QS_5_54_17]|nr:MAG: hypothetical protein BRC19_02265 [Candidatus Saccharibacteria bacterium QS_5_54_17]